MSSEFASGERAVCYSGGLGTCDECDSQGSCICSGFFSANSDFILMDRSRWDEQQLLCPIFIPLLSSLYAIAAIVAAESIRRGASSLKFQIEMAARNKQSYCEYLPPAILCLGLLAMATSIALAAVKIFVPNMVFGVDILPSLLLFIKQILFTSASAIYAFHVVKIALRNQEVVIGSQKRREAANRQFFAQCFKAVLYAGTSMIQLIAAALGTSGYSASLDQQVVLALAVYISEAARLLISACLVIIDHRKLMRSFNASVESAKAALRLASGTSAIEITGCADEAPTSAPVNAAAQRPQLSTHMQIYQDEVDALERAATSVKRTGRKLLAVAISSLVMWFVICVCPLLWNKASYAMALQCVIQSLTFLTIVQAFAPSVSSRPRRREVVQEL